MTDTTTGLGIAFITILSAAILIMVGLFVFRLGWLWTQQAANEPGSIGYDSKRGSGTSAGNVARMESEGSSGKKINLI